MVQEIDIRPGGQGRFVERGQRQAEGIESLRQRRDPMGLNLPRVWTEEDYASTPEGIATRKEHDFFVPEHMFLTDEEKQDRSGILNFLSSAMFMGPVRPRKIEQIAGQETEDPLDDFFADKYTGNLFTNEQFPKLRSPGEVSIRRVPVTNEMVGIEEDPTGQYTIDPALKAYQDYRFTKTGTDPVGNLLGVLELPTVVSLLPLLGAGAKGGFNLIRRRLKSAGRSADEIAAIEKQFNTIFNSETRQAIQGAKSQEEAVNIIGERMNLLNMGPAGGRIAETIKTIDKTGALAGTGTKTEVGKYRNIFENLGLNLRFDRSGSYRPETVIKANEILSQIKSPYDNVKHLKDNILDVNFDKHINKTLKQLKLDKDTYLTAKEIGLILGLKNVEAWPHTMRTLTTTTTKSGEASAQAMLGIRKIDKRGVGQGPGVKYHLGDTIDSLKGLGEARVQRGITSSLNETLAETQSTWTRNLFNKKFNEIATKAEKETIKNLKKEQTIANKGLTKSDPNFQEIDHIQGLQVSLTANKMGREQFKQFLKNKNIDILDIVDQQSWNKYYDEFLKTFNETDVFNTVYNINNPRNFALIPKSEQFRTGLTKTTVFDSPKGGLQAKQENLIRVSNELADLQFLKANAKSITNRDLKYFIDTYGKTKNRKFAMDKETFLKGVTKRINDLKYDIKIMKKNINKYLDKAQELEAKQIKIPNLKSSKYPDPELFVKGGRVGFKSGGTEFDALVEMYMREYGMERRDAVTEALRDLGKLKQGGRVGYKKGGTVTLKINPEDYVVKYSDGTKLYKINSFIRDVANQVD